jgi:hypothetical protein
MMFVKECLTLETNERREIEVASACLNYHDLRGVNNALK